MIKKIGKTIRRKINAYRFGIVYHRASTWKLPTQITFLNENIQVKGPDDIGTSQAFLDIFLDDTYGLKKLREKDISSVIDIGGHAGFFSLYTRSLFPKASIHCYEPSPELAPFTAHQSKVGHFTFFPYAVGLKSGYISLDQNQDSVQTKVKKSDGGTIPMIAFRECLAKFKEDIGILKLDCEGSEWDILKEDKDIWKKVKYLCMEYHLIDNHTVEELEERLQVLDFKIVLKMSTGTTWGILHARRNYD